MLPREFMKKPELQRAQIYREIGDALNKLDRASYPTICKLIKDDEQRVAIMDYIIGEMYGGIKNLSLMEALSAIETSISEE